MNSKKGFSLIYSNQLPIGFYHECLGFFILLHKYKIFVCIFVCHPQIEIDVEIIVKNLSKA